jgi:hypothetical protein
MPFVPTDIAGCKLWLKADAGVYKDSGVTPAANGDEVLAWLDQSGNGNHVSASAGQGPSYQTNILNGHPAILGNAAGSRRLSLAAAVVTGQAYSAFSVARTPPASDTAQRAILHVGDTGGGFALETRAGFREILYRSVQVLVDGAQPSVATDEVWSATRTAAPLTKFYVGGVSQSPTNSTSSMNAPSSLTSVLALDGDKLFWDSYLYEVLVYDSALSDGDRGSVESYLGRWFTPASPAGKPWVYAHQLNNVGAA